jgi:hypothetical protein
VRLRVEIVSVSRAATKFLASEIITGLGKRGRCFLHLGAHHFSGKDPYSLIFEKNTFDGNLGIGFGHIGLYSFLSYSFD